MPSHGSVKWCNLNLLNLTDIVEFNLNQDGNYNKNVEKLYMGIRKRSRSKQVFTISSI